MPRHRKSRKNRKKQYRKQQLENSELGNCLTTPNDLNLTTPVRNPISPSTPVNKRRSFTANNETRLSGVLTNLNLLFDTSLAARGSDSCLPKKNVEFRKRSSSSIAKLHSPGKEKALLLHKSTQTTDSFLELQPSEVTETPRISHVRISQEPLNNTKTVINKLTKFSLKEVNINPYLKNIEETSFFCQHLFDSKPSSTPISKNEDNKSLEALNDNIIRDNVENSFNLGISNKIDTILNDETARNTPEKTLNRDFKFDDINLNTPVSQKIIEKNQTISSLKSNKRKSPKLGRVSNHSKTFKYASYSRLTPSKRTNESNTRHPRLGIYERLVMRIKRYSKVSAKWSLKAAETCAQLGINIKNGLASLYKLYNTSSLLECSTQNNNVCKCEEYRTEMQVLTERIEELSNDFRNVQIQIRHNCEVERNKDNQVIEGLRGELNKVKQELTQFSELRTELSALKEDFQCLKTTPSIVPLPPAKPAPCAPPLPPPPPPPMPATTMMHKSPFKLIKRSKTTLGTGDPDINSEKNSRPVISLDDILKVKLKKPSDRALAKLNTPVSRQPTVISMDVLRQVKLKPACRSSLVSSDASTPVTDVSVVSEMGSTSPYSSLHRLLNEDSSAKKGLQ